jgi:hypothetical protein
MRKPRRLKALVASGALLGATLGFSIGVTPTAHASTWSDYGPYFSYISCDLAGDMGQGLGWWLAHYCDFRIYGAELYVLYPN